MNKSIKDWINGKTNKAVFKVENISTGHKQHRSGSGIHDNRPKRMRTRGNALRSILKEF